MTSPGLVLHTPHSWEMPLEGRFPSFPRHGEGGDGFAVGLLPVSSHWCCRGARPHWITLSGAAAGGATARHCCHPLSLLLTSALFALGPAVLPVSQCLRWPRWLWKLSRHCQGDTLAIEPSPPYQPPARPHTASKVLWGPRASLLHWRVMGVFAGRFNQCLVSLLGSKAPFFSSGKG